MAARILALILLPWLAPAATAGPWPRAPAEVFAAATSGIEDAASRHRSFAEAYVEYGMGPQWVLGSHLRRSSDGEWRGDIFARWHPAPAGPAAFGFAVGARLTDDAEDRRVAPLLSAHLGRGTDTRFGNFWARAGIQLVGNARHAAERDISAQMGVRTGWGGLAMLSLVDHRTRESRTLKLTPALGYTLRARNTVVVGATLLPQSRRVDGLHLSVWFNR